MNTMMDIKKMEHKGETVFYEVSPCSWMYKGYGLQVRISMKERAVNAESEFLLDKTTDAHGVAPDKLEAKAALTVAEWLKTNGTKPLHESVAKWARISAEFEQKFADEEKKTAERIKRTDARRKREGYTHKLDAWIHPARGEDFMITVYGKQLFTKEDIADQLRASTVKNDYAITEL